MDAQAVPDVSVIIPAYNALPYIHRGLESLVTQTIGTSRMEVVVVDDGSTDGTGEALDEWAGRHPGLFKVVHGAASGGPATPRNTGLDLARGRYVFFLDADDYLGAEALERLVATADEQHSDIVIGKMVATSERLVPSSMFRRTDLDVDLFTSRIYWTLASLKLFRRSHIEDHDLRFPTHFPNASDQPFTALAYLRARKISVLSDYDFYHVVLRDDGQHVTLSGPLSNELDVAEAMCDLVASEVIDVDRRAPLLTRHFQIDVRRVMMRLVDSPRAEQEALLSRAADLVRTHMSPGVQQRLTPDMRVFYHLVEHGLVDEALAFVAHEVDTDYRVLVEGSHAFAQLSHFRDPRVAVPDELFEVSDRLRHECVVESFECHEGGRLSLAGRAGLLDVVEPTEVALVLRAQDDPEVEHVLAGTRAEGNAFHVDADLLSAADGQPLPEGTWKVHVRISREGVSRVWRLALGDAPADERVTDSFAWAATESDGGWTAAAHLTGNGRLSLDVKCRRGASGKQFSDWKAAWDGDDLVIRAQVAAPRSAAPVRFVLRGPEGDVRRVPADREGAELVGRVPLADLAPGRWQVRLRVGKPPAHRPVSIVTREQPDALSWRDGLAEISVELVQEATLALDVAVERAADKVSKKLRSIIPK